MSGFVAADVGIASGRPGRWHGRVAVTRDHPTDARLVVVEDERCPHDHKTRQAAKDCSMLAWKRITANGGEWLDPENPRRYRRTFRRGT